MASQQPVALIVGGSRGIGRQVAIDLAKNGYTVVVAAKSTSDAYASNVPFPPNPNSPQSTINTVEREIREAGGQATAIQVDTRDVKSIQHMVDEAIRIHHHIDVLIYNSGAIWWAPISQTPLSRFLLMQRINPEGLYATIQALLPHFAHTMPAWKARIIVVSPPIYSRFFRGKTAYAMGKVGMSVLTKGLAMDFEREGKKDMGITSIWPAVAIESAATAQMVKDDPSTEKELRKASIFSDAILAMLKAPVADVNGMLELDEDFLRVHEGVVDFEKYNVVKGSTPRRIMPRVLPDLSVEEQDDEGRRTNSVAMRRGKGEAKL